MVFLGVPIAFVLCLKSGGKGEGGGGPIQLKNHKNPFISKQFTCCYVFLLTFNWWHGKSLWKISLWNPVKNLINSLILNFNFRWYGRLPLFGEFLLVSKDRTFPSLLNGLAFKVFLELICSNYAS